jgi:hypothetical protein
MGTFENLVDQLYEAYEDEAHPETVRFWRGLRQGGHQFSQHPILRTFGHELSRGGWEYTSQRVQQSGLDMRELMSLYQQVQRIERAHAQELVDLAKRITMQIWGVPEEMLEGRLTGEVGIGSEFEEEEELPDERLEVTDEVNKRLTMNALTHGSAVHAMMTMHHVVDQEINRIDRRLLPLYNKLTAGAHHYHWLIDVPAMLAMLGDMATGSTRVRYEPDEEGEETPVVDARATCFPVLAQEMSKGVAELISHHGLAHMDEPTAKAVLSKADDIRHEPWLIQIGPELWRRFLAVKPRNLSLADLYYALATQTPVDLHRIVYAVIREPDEAAELLNELVKEPEEFDIEEWEPEEEEWEPEEPDEGWEV